MLQRPRSVFPVNRLFCLPLSLVTLAAVVSPLIVSTIPTTALAQVPTKKGSSFVRLNKAMAAALQDKKLQKTTIGVHVVDVKTGEVLYGREVDRPMNPASNMKLFTAAASLDVMGPEKTWTTVLQAKSFEKGVVKGLSIKASGDPLLHADHMLRWAYTLKRQGVRRIDGDLIIDTSVFDDKTIPPGFDQKTEDASYRAPVGAFSVNFNASHVHILPGAPGKPAVVRLVPDNGHVKIDNQTKTVPGKRGRVRVKSVTKGKGTVMVITGSMGAEAKKVIWKKRIDAPALYAGAVFTRRLNALGITHKGAVRLGKASGKVVLLQHESSPLSRAITIMNKWSNNFIAEQLLKNLGGPQVATAAKGRAQIMSFLKKYKINAKGFKPLNGSGLYSGNLVTVRHITSLLRVMHSHPRAAEFVASLPIAGVDGTLLRRMTSGPAKGNLRGKTGTLNQVTALSGYMTTAKGRLVAYSIIFNDPPTYAWRLRAQQDQLAQVIAASTE